MENREQDQTTEGTSGQQGSDRSVPDMISSLQRGFQTPDISREPPEPPAPVRSPLSDEPAITCAQLEELTEGEGLILYWPRGLEEDFEVGDVLYIRERDSGENGLVVQSVEKGTVNYPQAVSKVLFRLMASVRAEQIQRSHNEPTEILDQFLSLRFKVRAAIVDSQWAAHEGRAVTRNVDIFRISPRLLVDNIIRSVPNLNLNLGDYKGEPILVYGGGFEKVNMITGMKEGGKSHFIKGILHEGLGLGMSTIVFDINDEYRSISPDNTLVLNPGPRGNLKFRMDFMEIESLFRLFNRLAPFPERTAYTAFANLPRLVRDRMNNRQVPDIPYLRAAVGQAVPGTGPVIQNMQDGYLRSLDVLDNLGLFMTEQEAQTEDQAIRNGRPSEVISLRSAFNNMMNGRPQLLVFQLGGLQPGFQQAIVMLVIDHLKSACDRQTTSFMRHDIEVPQYPTVVFEEAHMYMDERDINDLVPVIRHIGLNIFFVTNTPGALPEAVFRLVDNLVMTRLVNHKDISRVVDCGLTDKETIEGFAENLRDHHVLFLSARNGATRNFPLVFHVRDFGLPPSGRTRSQWEAMRERGGG
jgi:hypothetical protein